MYSLFDTAQRLWNRFEWSAPPFLERHLMPGLFELEELVVPLIKPNLEVYELRGQGAGSPLSVTYIGIDYVKWYLKRVMFVEEPEEFEKKPVSVRRPHEMTSLPDTDIVVVAASERLIRHFPSQNAIILPLYVQNILDLRGDWEALKRRLRKSKSVRNEFSWFNRFDYSIETSHDIRDLETHYYTMYLPTMDTRYGDAAHIVSIEEAKLHLRYGLLLLLKQDGRLVGSALCRDRGEKITWITLGVANADEQLIKQNVIGALYISLIRWANQAGYKALDFLGCPPYLNMGVYRFKRKWGTGVGIPPHSHKQIWIKFFRNTPAVRQFLIANPCAVIDENGDLQGLVVVGDADEITPDLEARVHKVYLAPGMKGLRIRTVSDLLDGLEL